MPRAGHAGYGSLGAAGFAERIPFAAAAVRGAERARLALDSGEKTGPLTDAVAADGALAAVGGTGVASLAALAPPISAVGRRLTAARRAILRAARAALLAAAFPVPAFVFRRRRRGRLGDGLRLCELGGLLRTVPDEAARDDRAGEKEGRRMDASKQYDGFHKIEIT